MACLLIPARSASYAGADAVRSRELQHRHVRHAELVETGRVELGDDPAVNGLGRHPEQGANQHLGRATGEGRHGALDIG